MQRGRSLRPPLGRKLHNPCPSLALPRSDRARSTAGAGRGLWPASLDEPAHVEPPRPPVVRRRREPGAPGRRSRPRRRAAVRPRDGPASQRPLRAVHAAAAGALAPAGDAARPRQRRPGRGQEPAGRPFHRPARARQGRHRGPPPGPGGDRPRAAQRRRRPRLRHHRLCPGHRGGGEPPVRLWRPRRGQPLCGQPAGRRLSGGPRLPGHPARHQDPG